MAPAKEKTNKEFFKVLILSTCKLRFCFIIVLVELFKNSQAGERFEWNKAYEEAKVKANSNLWTGIITLATLSILLNFSLGFYIWHQRKTRQNSADSESSQLPSKIFSEKSLEFESASKDIKENNIRDK